MPLLVDGHNLIGQIPGISLAAADDEAQLVMLLRGYAMRKRGRQVVVVFDRGVYGHPQVLDGYGVTCYFAKSPQDADAQLINRLKRINRPGEWRLVTSDQRVAGVARERGVQVIDSREFAARLSAPQARAAEKRDMPLSEADVEEWLRLFGERSPAEVEEDEPLPGVPPSAPGRDPGGGAARKRKRRR